MNADEVANRFNRLYLGDSLLQWLELRTGAAECRFQFSVGKVLPEEGATIFEPSAQYKPALLRLEGVRAICFDTTYQLNSTVVDFGARPSDQDGYVEFYFDLTGASDSDAFLVKMKILARDFELGPSTE